MKRIGFGQVEPNHLSAQKTGQIYGQLPVDSSIEILENGQFVKYDYKEGKVDYTGAGEWMMVFNEVKLYDGYRETYKDYAMKSVNNVDGEMTPRVIKLNIGDIYTTNCLEKANTDEKAEIEMTDVVVGDVLSPNASGYLEKNENADYKLEVVKVYTLADGQEAVKLMRIA
jgi:hypothetical protein